MRERREASRFNGDIRCACGGSTTSSVHQDPGDAQEELARSEKAAGLEELFASRLTVLVGPAGTGKTSVLEALVQRPEIQADGVLLLAPTGKARVQLQSKVGHTARTLASFLVKKGGYDSDTGRYLVGRPGEEGTVRTGRHR